jgi:regulator of sigma E protease
MDWIASGLFQALCFILVLSVVVVVHEFGHYLAARMVGVRVEVFSLGFGNAIVGWKRGPTEFRISWIPLGGYVRMAGEGSLEAEATGAPDEYESKRVWEKLLILVAGPVANVLLAIALYTTAYVIGVPIPAYFKEAPHVAGINSDSPAQAAGLAVGDRIVALDDTPFESWEVFETATLLRPEDTVELSVMRGDQALTLPMTIEARGKHRIGYTGIVPWCRLEVAEVSEGSAAEAAGLREGDVVRELDGEPTCSTATLGRLVQAGEGGVATLLVERGGERLELAITPTFDEESER